MKNEEMKGTYTYIWTPILYVYMPYIYIYIYIYISLCMYRYFMGCLISFW